MAKHTSDPGLVDPIVWKMALDDRRRELVEERLPPGYALLTTMNSPRSHPGASPRGWKTHIVKADTEETPADAKKRTAFCGLTPAHGWDVDMFIDEPCFNCVKKLAKMLKEGDDGK